MRVPRGNTQKGVNEAVVRALLTHVDLSGSKVLLDIPCGEGELTKYLQSRFTWLKVIGVDISDQQGLSFEFHKMDAHAYIKNVRAESFDIINCVSGVMCFDQLKDMFFCFNRVLKPNGLIIVTNDNIMTIRDRLNFLFFGRFKRFKLVYPVDEGIWNIVPPQAVAMHLRRNGFKDIRFEYTSVYIEDWFLIPIALIFYPIFFSYLVCIRSEMTVRERINLFPFKSLLGRHYIVVAHKS